MPSWKLALELDEKRQVTSGSQSALRDAVGRGADLRIGTAFRHNEHIDTSSDSPEMVLEVPEFGETCLIDDRWAAGFMTLRQPIDLPDGFGPRASMSFFLYNEDGNQAVARPYLDGPPSGRRPWAISDGHRSRHVQDTHHRRLGRRDQRPQPQLHLRLRVFSLLRAG